MYSHLLVPLDDSDLSISNANDAAKLAAALGARITFLHAVPDYAATSEGALVFSMDPAGFAERAVGQTQAILAKACTVAAGAGVKYDTYATVSDRPAEAILEAAIKNRCDLIVMASRGPATGLRALLNRSQTKKVLDNAPVALLVTRVASHDPQAAANHAIAVIQDEHRSLATVVRGMLRSIEEARAGDGFDRDTFERMLQYVLLFPGQRHHPKEEQYLYAKLRLRRPEALPLIQQLEAEHLREHELVEAVQAALRACPTQPTADAPALLTLHQRMDELTQAIWAHMQTEEYTLTPLARESLDAKDWEEVGQKFDLNNDPNFGDLGDSDFRRLFTTIANLMAKPRGVREPA